MPRRHHPALGLGTAAIALIGLATSGPGCLNRPLEPIKPRTTTRLTTALPQSRVDKIDILLTIDDSASMADKQAILAEAVPDLVGTLVNPPCLDADGRFSSQPDGPLSACPSGSAREFEPVVDVHIGVISTSLGARGGVNCDDPNGDDGARLLDETLGGGTVDTFESKGFLAWRPEADAGVPGRYDDAAALTADIGRLVEGVDQQGCGYEASLESWYRFLVDPDPYLAVERDGNNNRLVGTDEALLQQRADFLRPDSLVAIVMLSDENDCSFNPAGPGWRVTDPNALYQLRSRSECADDINDPCCAPCGAAPDQCPTDPSCEGPAPADHDRRLSNLSCFEMKRRFGYDFLFDIQRYVDGLTSATVLDRNENEAPNPLLVGADGTLRGANNIFLAGIVGVPWQLVARDEGDLAEGLMTPAELAAAGRWDAIVGNSKQGVAPQDPHMVESTHPREGLPGPDASFGADPWHGHDYEVFLSAQEGQSHPIGDLQYACTFPIAPTTCEGSSCDCPDPKNYQNNPLCQAPDGSYGNVQYRAKAYPSLRQLEVLKGIGNQAIVGSICPAQLEADTAADYGYKPAVAAIIDRLKNALKGPCFTRSLSTDANEQVQCVVLEGRKLNEGDTCDCDHAPGRNVVSPELASAEKDARATDAAQTQGLDCFCQIEQLRGEARQACTEEEESLFSVDGSQVDGWCYIDHSTFPTVGDNSGLVDHCPSGQKRAIRFVGEGEPVVNSVSFITCDNAVE